MKKRLFSFMLLASVCIFTGCGKSQDDFQVERDERGLYLISSSFSIYSDEEDPKFMEYGVKTSIKEFLPQSNCTASCIHDYQNPTETLSDGTAIYQYDVEGETYYYIQCNKSNSKYHNGKDILIGKNKNKLISLC